MVIAFADLLESLAAAPVILTHKPSAVEVMDKSILDNTRQNAAPRPHPQAVHRRRSRRRRCASSFTAIEKEDLPPRLGRARTGSARATISAIITTPRPISPAQARIWSLREAALGLSMAMKEDAKSISFVEDTAVAPEKLSEFIGGFWRSSEPRNHGRHLRPRIGRMSARAARHQHEDRRRRPQIRSDRERKWRTWCSNSVARFRASMATAWCAARSCARCSATRCTKPFARSSAPSIRWGFSIPARSSMRRRSRRICASARVTRRRSPTTWFDYSEYGGMGGAVEMCSGVGRVPQEARRHHVSFLHGDARGIGFHARPRQRAASGDVGQLGEAGLGDEGVYRGARPVSGMPRVQSGMSGGRGHGALQERISGRTIGRATERRCTRELLGNIASRCRVGAAGSRRSRTGLRVRRGGQRKVLGIDQRRKLPTWKRETFERWLAQAARDCRQPRRDSVQRHLHQSLRSRNRHRRRRGSGARRMRGERRASRMLRASADLARPAEGGARARRKVVEALVPDRRAAEKRFCFCEPSCLSAVKEDAPSLLRGEQQKKARAVAEACMLFEEFAATLDLPLRAGPRTILLHGHCHQKSMGLLGATISLLSRDSRRRTWWIWMPAAAAWRARSAIRASITMFRSPSPAAPASRGEMR